MGIDSMKNFFNNLGNEKSIENNETPKMVEAKKNIDQLFANFDQRM